MEDIKPVVMIGAGPSALAAAIYTTREGIATTLYEKGVVGGLAAITDKIDNYPGFPDGVPGMELADNLRKQAERFGAKIDYGDVSALRHQDGVNILTVDGQEVKARAVLIATGSGYKNLGIPGEAEFYGRGVHYCATCNGAFYKGLLDGFVVRAAQDLIGPRVDEEQGEGTARGGAGGGDREVVGGGVRRLDDRVVGDGRDGLLLGVAEAVAEVGEGGLHRHDDGDVEEDREEEGSGLCRRSSITGCI